MLHTFQFLGSGGISIFIHAKAIKNHKSGANRKLQALICDIFTCGGASSSSEYTPFSGNESCVLSEHEVTADQNAYLQRQLNLHQFRKTHRLTEM